MNEGQKNDFQQTDIFSDWLEHLTDKRGARLIIPSCVQMNATWYKAAGTDARKFLKQLGFPVFQKLWRTAFNAN